MDNRSFDLFDLELFQTVVKAGSLSAAATLIDLPLSTVSRRIKHLEDRAKSRLFERTSRGLNLTEAGDILLKSSELILQEFDNVFSKLNEHNTVIAGRVVVHCPPSTFTHLFTNFLPLFNLQYPEIELDIVTSLTDVCFIDERIDIFLHTGILPDSTMIARHLFDSEIDYYASEDYIKKYGMPSIENIKEHKFICFSPFMKNPSVWGFSDEKPLFAYKPSIISDDFLLCSQQVKAGVGIGVLPKAMFINKHTNDGLIALFDKNYRRILPAYAVLSSKRYVPNKVKAFVEFFTEYLHQQK